ncbi:catechol 2,3-dioxygenase-like lactoylglutathione lyase family enzyme [Saccharothrix ecbatanensis]|uniref:Catechol 2,3-dioxygenase-like lactoylglutathione lyase family enzyme n=1 Tax=Saccharothrix ecbatanensis TaxID=1105145 RepID=A0A7W9HSM3_9PSEU|nr:glyoxalase superfamily protein [Saccharothrix ecbatanensis]MBB5807515.1 catechol 2,3-dioxygenase-like lactoylglutathione lyase family enzyme [Saccharothrix ecbatanensis]
MDWKLEVVIVPVSDVDRAKAFYADTLGFTVDTDHSAGDSFRVVQVTPPGSACSIVFGHGMGLSHTPGSLKGCQLVVSDIQAAHAHLEANGVANSGPQHFENGTMTPGPDPQDQDYGSFIFFDDPDGNTWAIQQVKRSAR